MVQEGHGGEGKVTAGDEQRCKIRPKKRARRRPCSWLRGPSVEMHPQCGVGEGAMLVSAACITRIHVFTTDGIHTVAATTFGRGWRRLERRRADGVRICLSSYQEIVTLCVRKAVHEFVVVQSWQLGEETGSLALSTLLLGVYFSRV